jgi:hypothetical protein
MSPNFWISIDLHLIMAHHNPASGLSAVHMISAIAHKDSTEVMKRQANDIAYLFVRPCRLRSRLRK